MLLSWRLEVAHADKEKARILINERASAIVAEIIVKKDMCITSRSGINDFEPILAFKSCCLGWSSAFVDNVIKPETLEGGGTVHFDNDVDDFVYALLFFLGINNSGLVKNENGSDPFKISDAAGNPVVLSHWDDYVKILTGSGLTSDLLDLKSVKQFAISFGFIKKSLSDLTINRKRNVVSF